MEWMPDEPPPLPMVATSSIGIDDEELEETTSSDEVILTPALPAGADNAHAQFGHIGFGLLTEDAAGER